VKQLLYDTVYVSNELNELILKHFFFNVTWEMCLGFAHRFT